MHFVTSVHKDVTERLSTFDYALYKSVQKVLGINLSERHMRGGIATKIKYETQKERASAPSE